MNFLVKDDVINFIHKYTIYNNVTGFLKKKSTVKMLGVFMSVCGGGHGGAREGDTGIVNKKQTNNCRYSFLCSREMGHWYFWDTQSKWT